jgi:hypothetical protein
LKTIWRPLKKLKIELSYNSTIPVVGICPKEVRLPQRHTHGYANSHDASVTDKWIKKM